MDATKDRRQTSLLPDGEQARLVEVREAFVAEMREGLVNRKLLDAVLIENLPQELSLDWEGVSLSVWLDPYSGQASWSVVTSTLDRAGSWSVSSADDFVLDGNVRTSAEAAEYLLTLTSGYGTRAEAWS